MEELKEKVSYLVFEGEMTRMERVNHRLWVLCICLLVVLIGTNAGWLYYESQWEVVETVETTTYDANSDRCGNAIINGSGEVRLYGESESNEDTEN